ncbi:MAG: ABC transporter ATP-binding protein [Actinomycetota bacterium]
MSGNGSAPAVLLEVDAVVAGFGANVVLHGCSYSVHEGEIAAVLGLNGAGKSVSTKVVAGIVPAREGAVRFRGIDVTRLPAENRVRLGMGHVPQGRQVFPQLTVEQNLRLGGYVQRRRDRSRYPAVLASVLDRFPRLAERRDQAAGTLSGGEQAMLAVGRALMSEPALLIVDEASAGLAPKAVEALFETLLEVHRSGVAILMIEQNVTFTLRVADRVHIMQTGRVVYEGAVAELDQDRVAEELGVGRLLGRSLSAAASGRKAPAASNGKARRPRAAARKRS